MAEEKKKDKPDPSDVPEDSETWGDPTGEAPDLEEEEEDFRPEPSADEFFGRTTLRGIGEAFRKATREERIAVSWCPNLRENPPAQELISPAGGAPLPEVSGEPRPSRPVPALPPRSSEPPAAIKAIGNRVSIPPPARLSGSPPPPPAHALRPSPRPAIPPPPMTVRPAPAAPKGSLPPPVLASGPAPKEPDPNPDAGTVEARGPEPSPTGTVITVGGLPAAMPAVKKLDPNLVETVKETVVSLGPTVIIDKAEPTVILSPALDPNPWNRGPTLVPPPSPPSPTSTVPPPPPSRGPLVAFVTAIIVCIAVLILTMQTRAAIQGDDVGQPGRFLASLIRRSQRQTPPAPTPVPVRRASPPVIVQHPTPRPRLAPVLPVAPAPQPLPTVAAPEPSAAPPCRRLGSFSTNVASAQQQAVQAGYAVTYLFPGESAATHTIVCRRE